MVKNTPTKLYTLLIRNPQNVNPKAKARDHTPKYVMSTWLEHVAFGRTRAQYVGMSDYQKLKKLDEESLKQLKEGTGPADECLCDILSTEEEKKSIIGSIKKVFDKFGKKGETTKKPGIFAKRNVFKQSLNIDISPKTEVLKRDSPCGKCGCDNENIVLKHSYASIQITTPDISSFCPCSSNCMPGKEKFDNNIKVFLERAEVPETNLKDMQE